MSELLPLLARSITAFVKDVSEGRKGRDGRGEAPVAGHKGLRVRVRNARGTYVLRYRDAAGALRSTVLGEVGTTDLPDVSAAYAASQEARRKGVDPIEAKAAEKADRALQVSSAKAAAKIEELTIKRLARAYLDSPAAAKLKTATAKGKRVERILADIGTAPAATFSRGDVLKATNRWDRLNGLAERNARVYTMRSIWKWARHQHAYEPLLPLNPWRDDIVPNQRAARDRVLTEGEMRRFLGWLPTCPEPAQTILRLCLLTGARIGNVVAAKCEWIDSNRLIIPASAFKTGVAHTITLSRQALAQTERQRNGRTSGWLFPSVTNRGQRHTRDNTVRDYVKRSGIDFNPHDLRRCIRTWAGENGIPREIAEHLIGHGKTGVDAIYNKASYAIPAAAAWQRWADYLDSLLPTTSNVVSIKRA